MDSTLLTWCAAVLRLNVQPGRDLRVAQQRGGRVGVQGSTDPLPGEGGERLPFQVGGVTGSPLSRPTPSPSPKRVNEPTWVRIGPSIGYAEFCPERTRLATPHRARVPEQAGPHPAGPLPAGTRAADR